MNKVEKDEIASLPDKYRPLTMWSIIGWNILFNIFFVGFILTVVFAFNRGNINRRSLARFWLLLKLLVIILIGVAVLILYLTGFLDMIIESVRGIFSQILPQ